MRSLLNSIVLVAFGTLAVLFTVDTPKGGSRISEVDLASTRGTNNQNPLKKDDNGNYLGYNCAGMIYGKWSELYQDGQGMTAYCTDGNDAYNCVNCPSQTWSATVDNTKTVPTGGYSPSGQITCSGFLVIGGNCESGMCVGGQTSTLTCDQNVQLYVQQQVGG